ncbi:unnamed protein product [Schistosoma curassoni]|uniref:Uncharacterized protein n=1 Tax=Schistosoma curassoni TaxID=6186 RepID=A0A183JF69_9TREM|nr:unnamed protein product [Schistosoma curassoni]
MRADKQKYLKDLSKTTERTSREENMRQQCKATKNLPGKYSKSERPIKDKEGKTITEIQELRSRYVEHFVELSKGSYPLNLSDIEAAHSYLPTDVISSIIEEITMAIRPIKSGKQQNQTTYWLKYCIQIYKQLQRCFTSSERLEKNKYHQTGKKDISSRYQTKEI